MPIYKTPGIYVDKISVLPHSVAEVETAIAAFIGYTETAKKTVNDDLLFRPTRISSLAEYELYFGKAGPESYDLDIVEDTTSHTYKVTATRRTTDPGYIFYGMYYAMKLFFANGGEACFVTSVGTGYNDTIEKGDAAASKGLLGGLAALEKKDEPTIIVIPDAVELASEDDFYDVMNRALDQCKRLRDRVVLIDVYNSDVSTFRSRISGNSDAVKFGAAYYPFLDTSINYYYTEDRVTVKSHRYRHYKRTEPVLTGKTMASDDIRKNRYGLYRQIAAEIEKSKVTLPPSPAVAGVYARVDKERGVWKAPANVSLNNVIKPSKIITDNEQASLNIDATAGKSINAIRTFPGKGTLVWGARTLAGNDNEWRYVSVRRFFNMVEESLKKSTDWAVFEPNDAGTWTRVKSMIQNYLTLKWREGALAGAKPDEAFFVKVGLGTTMTQLDITEGRMIVETGMAVVRPAEFIILRFSHRMQ